MSAQQIILDTDSGFFGDDGVALTMLLRSARRPDLRGITVVSGNVWSPEGAAFMARTAKLLDAPGLPVLTGAQAPLVHTADMRRKQQKVTFAGAFDLPFPTAQTPAAENGIDFMIRTIDAAPGEVGILAIGPLTNLAIALRLRPDLAPKIAALVIMGGSVHVPGNATPSAEFNFWFDPEAAQIVLRSEIPHKILFALDVCNKFHFTRPLFDQIAAVETPITALYREDFGNRYPGFLKDAKAQGSLWDELAASYLIDPTLVNRTESLFLDVDPNFGPRYGAVMPLDKSFAPRATPVTVVLDMDFPRVVAIYKTALTGR